MKQESVIGIVGGMGPQAGADLFERITRHTGVHKDQQHLSVVLMSFPGLLVDRTAFLEGKENVNPAYDIVKVIRKLEQAGAHVIGMACNTSYSPKIYDVIVNELDNIASPVNLLHMPKETCQKIKEAYPSIRRVGIMATNGTFYAGVYQHILSQMGMEVVVPSEQFQHEVIHNMVYHPAYGIKSGNGKNEVVGLMEETLDFFKAQSADAVILGCTEFSLVPMQHHTKGMLMINSNDVLAQALIREAYSIDFMKNYNININNN